LTLLSIAGGAIAGAYCGFSEAKGIKVHPAILYTPTILAGFIGTVAGAGVARNPKTMGMINDEARRLSGIEDSGLPEHLKENAIRQAEGCTAGCGPWGVGVIQALVTGAFTAAGYWVGKKFS
jgi:hypothetical protein